MERGRKTEDETKTRKSNSIECVFPDSSLFASAGSAYLPDVEGRQPHGGGNTQPRAIGLLQTETFVFICMAAMPLIYDGLFIAQSRRKKGSLITGCLVMAAVIYTDNQDVFQSFDISTETIVNIFVPLLVLLTILIGRRWLGVIISIVVAVATLYRVYEIQNVAGILTSDSNVMCMAIGAEILYGMGIIMGLVGLRKKEGNEE